MEHDLLHYYQHIQSYDWTDVADHWRGPETLLHRMREATVRTHITAISTTDPWLDIGCGTGLCSRHLPPHSVGIDVNPRNIEKLRQYAPHISGRVAEAEHVPFDNETFANVLCTEVLEHFRNPTTVLHEIHRILQPGGTLLATTPRRSLLWHFRGLSCTCTKEQHEPFHREFRAHELRVLLEDSGFHVRKLIPCCLRMQWLIIATAR